MKTYFLIIILAISNFLYGQYSFDSSKTADSSYIKIHFLYGSKPKKEYKDVEKNWFGGIHGGHVSIEAEGKVYGFEPSGSLHIVAKNVNNRHSVFIAEKLGNWVQDTATLKYTTIIIPVSSLQLDSLLKITAAYVKEPPYDYAVIGMRCAAATHDVLGRIGIIEWTPKYKNTFKNFYPKLFRKKMLKLAKKRGYKIIRKPGRTTRKWEKD